MGVQQMDGNEPFDGGWSICSGAGVVELGVTGSLVVGDMSSVADDDIVPPSMIHVRDASCYRMSSSIVR